MRVLWLVLLSGVSVWLFFYVIWRLFISLVT